MRRRKHRFPMPSDKTGVGGLAAGVNGGKSLKTALNSISGLGSNRFEEVFKSDCCCCSDINHPRIFLAIATELTVFGRVKIWVRFEYIPKADVIL